MNKKEIVVKLINTVIEIISTLNIDNKNHYIQTLQELINQIYYNNEND